MTARRHSRYHPRVLNYATPSPPRSRSIAGTSIVCALLGLSLVTGGVSFATVNGDVGVQWFLAAIGASIVNIPALLVFRKRIPAAVAVTAWTFAGLACVAVVGLLLIAVGLFMP
jgi:hypothetical protein